MVQLQPDTLVHFRHQLGSGPRCAILGDDVRQLRFLLLPDEMQETRSERASTSSS